MRHVWSVFCRTVVTDKDSNAVSLMQCIEAIVAGFRGTEPGTEIPLNSALVSFWRRSDPDRPESGRLRFRLQGPDGELIREAPYEMDLMKHSAGRVTLEVPGLPYRGDGVYEFVVSVDDPATGVPREAARVPFPVEVRIVPDSGTP